MIQIAFMQTMAAAMAVLVDELSAALNLPVPFTAEQLRDAVQGWRRIRIDLVPYRMGTAKIYGLCKCARPSHYIIFYRCDGTTFIQQQRIIFHELCHIILSHVSPLNPTHALRVPLTVTLQDQEAETFAEIATRSGRALGRRLTIVTAPLSDATTSQALDQGLDAHSDEASSDQFDEFLRVMGGRG